MRERRGLCYDCASYPEAQKGVLYISCGIAADARVEAENAIAALSSMSLVSGYREIEDSAAAIAVWYENRRAAGIDTSPQETAEQVLSCTREALADCAAALTQDTLYFLRGTCADGGEEEDYDDDTD